MLHSSTIAPAAVKRIPIIIKNTLNTSAPGTKISHHVDCWEGTPGVSGKVFQALGHNGINVSAIAQGASERNISLVIDKTLRIRALKMIPEAFFERKRRWL